MFNNVEDAFKDLDKQEYSFFARALSSYFNALMSEGFARDEAMRLVETYSKFIYDMSIEEYLRIQNKKDDEEIDEDDID